MDKTGLIFVWVVVLFNHNRVMMGWVWGKADIHIRGWQSTECLRNQCYFLPRIYAYN